MYACVGVGERVAATRLCLFGGFDPPPGPRPLFGHCPGLILRLAAMRLPGARRLCSMPSLAYGATVTSAASHAFIFHRKWALCAHSVFYIIRSVVFRNHGCTRVSLSAKEPPLCGSAFSGASTPPGAATALRPLPGANIETCRYAAARRSAPLLHARPCIWGNRHQRGVTCIYIP